MDEPDLGDIVLQAIDAGDERLLRACADRLEARVLVEQRFPDSFVDLVAELVADPGKHDSAYELLKVLRRRPTFLSDAQKKRVNAALRATGWCFRCHIFDEAEVGDRIRQALAADDEDQLQQLYVELDNLDLGLAQYPDGFTEWIVRLLGEPGFRAAQYSHYVLLVLGWGTDFFGQLGEEQKESLLPALESAYGEFADPMSCFIIAELLGEQYADERALAVLRRLMHVPAEVPRSLIPHALEHLARAKDPSLASQARDELTRMLEDPNPEVRGEAQCSLELLALRATD